LEEEAGDVVIFNGPQSGWHVRTCFEATNVGEAVFVTAKVIVVSTGEVIAGGEGKPDRAAVALVGYDEETCHGAYDGLLALVDDLWPLAPTDPEVCAWRGELIRVELTVEELSGGRRGTVALERRAVLDGVDGPLACP
jgi:hypothetical protein